MSIPGGQSWQSVTEVAPKKSVKPRGQSLQDVASTSSLNVSNGHSLQSPLSLMNEPLGQTLCTRGSTRKTKIISRNIVRFEMVCSRMKSDRRKEGQQVRDIHLWIYSPMLSFETLDRVLMWVLDRMLWTTHSGMWARIIDRFNTYRTISKPCDQLSAVVMLIRTAGEHGFGLQFGGSKLCTKRGSNWEEEPGWGGFRMGWSSAALRMESRGGCATSMQLYSILLVLALYSILLVLAPARCCKVAWHQPLE